MGVIGQGRRGAGKNREEQKKINSAIKTIKIIDKKKWQKRRFAAMREHLVMLLSLPAGQADV